MDLAGLTLKSSAELWMQAARQPLMSLNTARGLKIPSLISYCILSYLYMLYLWCCSTRSYRVNLQYQNAIVPCFPASIFLPTPEEETWDLVDFQPPELHLAPQQRPWKVIGNSLSRFVSESSARTESTSHLPSVSLSTWTKKPTVVNLHGKYWKIGTVTWVLHVDGMDHTM